MVSKIEFRLSDNFNEQLEREWLYLSELSTTSIFQSYSWQSIWNENINQKNKKNSLLIINVYADQKIIGIIPFEKKKKLNLKTLSLTGYPFADYCDCLINKNFFEANPKVKDVIIRYILNLKNIDLITLENLSEDNNFIYLFGKNSFKVDVFHSYQLTKNIYDKNILEKKFLNDTKRQIKRLSILGRLSYKVAITELDKKKIFKFFLHNKQKQLAVTNNWNYLNNELYQNFLYNLFIYNNAHLSSLSLNDEIIAVHMGNIFKKKLLYLFPTYDNNYSKYSPGNILLYELIRDFFSKDGNEFDFTTGNEQYKIKLSNTKRKMFYKNIALTFTGKIVSISLRILNNLKKIKELKLIYNKIRY